MDSIIFPGNKGIRNFTQNQRPLSGKEREGVSLPAITSEWEVRTRGSRGGLLAGKGY
jgi:hypothetical protein